LNNQLHQISIRTVYATLTAAGLSVVLGAIFGNFFDGAPLGNDNSSHYAEITYIAELLRLGETDFWFDQTNLGYPLFLAYQPAPSLLMGALTALCKPLIDPMLLFKLSVVIVWALIPAAWYWGGRWLGMDRLSALVFGLLVMSVSDFRTFGLGMTSVTATGLYTQSYGTLLLPLAMGGLYRYLFERDVGLKVPTLLFSATLLTHAYFGLYLALAGAVMVIVRRDGLVDRARRLAPVFMLSGLITAFWLVPFVLNMEYQGGLPWRGKGENGYPVLELARLAVTGQLFDYGRLPWISVLIVVGVILAWRRRTGTLERFTLLLLGLTIVLLLGRTTWGSLYSLIPLHAEIEVIRYLNGVHFCGLLLAGPAAAFVVKRLSGWIESLPGPTWLSPRWTTFALLAAAFGGYLFSVTTSAARHLRSVDESELHLPQLVAALESDQSSRFLSHKKLGTGSHFYLNLLPALAERPQLESFSRGYHDTLSLYYLEYFDFTVAAFRLYNVGAVVVRKSALEEVPDFMTQSWTDGEFYVYEDSEARGYFEFIRTPLTLVGGLKELRPVAAILSPRLFNLGVLPRISAQLDPDADSLIVRPRARADLFQRGQLITENERAGRLLSRLLRDYSAEPGRSEVLEQNHAPNEYSALVDSSGAPERLLLKVSFHPFWTAEVDGERTGIDHVAPNLMVVDVPSGRHRVRLRFRNPNYQKALFIASVLGVIVWCALGAIRPWRRRRLT
jgi:hypothetical protein